MADKLVNPFHQWVDLAQPRLGTEVVYATDDSFADKSRLIDPAEPVFIPDKYDDHGNGGAVFPRSSCSHVPRPRYHGPRGGTRQLGS